MWSHIYNEDTNAITQNNKNPTILPSTRDHLKDINIHREQFPYITSNAVVNFKLIIKIAFSDSDFDRDKSLSWNKEVHSARGKM